MEKSPKARPEAAFPIPLPGKRKRAVHVPYAEKHARTSTSAKTPQRYGKVLQRRPGSGVCHTAAVTRPGADANDHANSADLADSADLAGSARGTECYLTGQRLQETT